MSVNSLGEFVFVCFHNPHDRGAPPLLPGMEGDLVQRAGVDGSSVMRLGIKAQPFQMRSGVDVLSFAGANDLLADYRATQNLEALQLVWGGVDYLTSYQTLYLPVDVQPIRIRPISGAAGGIYGTAAAAWVEALWTLLPLRSA